MQLSENIWNNKNLVETLKKNGIAVIPTDTVYGIVGRAESPTTVERIYKARKRNPEKSCIILIGDIGELEKFSITLSEKQKEKLKEYWSFDLTQDKPEAVSVVLDCSDNKFEYLHRGTETLAFRLPVLESLREFLLKTGPLVAPSANPEGSPVANNVNEAKEYFGDFVDLYIDGGKIEGKASKIVKLHKDGSVSILRE